MATTKDCVQWALEETPRYEGAATTTPLQVSTAVHYPRIQTLGFAPNRQDIDRMDELAGIEGALPLIPETFAPTGALKMRGYINSLTWLLTTLGYKAVYTAGDGVITDPDGATIPAATNRWVFGKRTGVTAKTLQMILAYATQSVFFKMQGVAANSLDIDAGGNVSAALQALVYSRIADPNLTPAYDVGTIFPIKRSDLTLTWLGSSGKCDDFSLNISNPLMPRKDYSVVSLFPNLMEQGDQKVAVTGKFSTSNLTTADIDAILAGTTFSALARWKTAVNIGATSYKYSIWFKMPACQYVDGSAMDIANVRRFGEDITFKAAWDETTSKDCEITIVNAVTAIDSGSPALGL